MGERIVEYDAEAVCDACGCAGAFDFYGDCFCSDCLDACDECSTVIVVGRGKRPEYLLCPECMTELEEENARKKTKSDN